MPIFDPFGFHSEFAAPDVPAGLPPTLIYETRAPNAYALQQQGAIVETQVAARRVQGEIFSTTRGDVIVRGVQVVSANDSYEVEVTQIDVGGGVDQLQIVATEEPPPDEVVEAVEDQSAATPASETTTSVDPYASTDTSAAVVSAEPIAVEAQDPGAAVVVEVPYDPTYQGQAYPTEVPVAAVNTGGGTTVVIDPSVYDQFGFT